jgi:hypothetical protein
MRASIGDTAGLTSGVIEDDFSTGELSIRVIYDPLINHLAPCLTKGRWRATIFTIRVDIVI